MGGEPIDPNADLVIYADDLVAPAVTDDDLVAPAPATGDDLVFPVVEGWSNKNKLLVGGGVALATVGGLGALNYVMRDLEKEVDFTWKKKLDSSTLGCAVAATALVGVFYFRHKIANFFSNLFGYGDVYPKPEDSESENSTFEGVAKNAVKRVAKTVKDKTGTTFSAQTILICCVVGVVILALILKCWCCSKKSPESESS